MVIEFNTTDSAHYAMNPRTEKIDSRRFLHFDSLNCSHVLLVQDPFAEYNDLFLSKEFRKNLEQLAEETGKAFFEMNCRAVPGTNLTVSCINYLKYQMNSQSLEIQDQSSRLHICGMLAGKNTVVLYVPDKGVRNTVDISLEMRFIQKPYMITASDSNALGKNRYVSKDTPYEYVFFEGVPGYVDGSVFYSISFHGRQFTIPILREMLGKSMLIKKPTGETILFKANGVTLRHVEEIG